MSIQTVRELRKVLRNFNKFDPHEIESALLLLELRDALGFNPMVAGAVTKRQREVIQVHLIEDREEDEAAILLGLGRPGSRYGGRRQMMLVERAGLESVLGYLKGDRIEHRLRLWRPWQIALLHDPRYTVSELATKIGKSELAVKLMISKLRKRHDERIPSRRRSRRLAS